AWDPLAFVRAESVISGKSKREVGYRGDFGRIRRWLEQARAQGDACVGLPGSAVALHALVGVHGPAEMSLGWSAPLQKQMADAVRRDRCPDYLQELISFDGGSWGFGDYLMTLSELYEPVGEIGPDLVVSRLRAVPAAPLRTPLPIVNRPNS